MRPRAAVVALFGVALLAVGCGGGDHGAADTSSSAGSDHVRPIDDRRRHGRGATTTVAATTTVPATTTAPQPSSSSPATTTVSALTGGLDLQGRTVLGFKPDNLAPLAPADLLAALTPVLGEPTRDTDWYTTSGGDVVGDCLGGIRQRIIRWGDLGFAFWDQQGVVSLWSWTLGDPSASFKGDRKEPLPIPMTPALPLTSSDGIAIGSAATELVQLLGPDLVFLDASGQPTSAESATLSYLSGFDARTPNLGFALADGRVTGISATLSFC